VDPVGWAPAIPATRSDAFSQPYPSQPQVLQQQRQQLYQSIQQQDTSRSTLSQQLQQGTASDQLQVQQLQQQIDRDRARQ
jgi:hypothetical protein